MTTYSDIREDRYKHISDIHIDSDVEAVINQIVNVLSIPPYSIPGRPEFATSLYNFLHLPDDRITYASIETVIIQLLQTYVDRITVQDVSVVSVQQQVIELDLTFIFKQDEVFKNLKLKLNGGG